jgi:hypothetical protein
MIEVMMKSLFRAGFAFFLLATGLTRLEAAPVPAPVSPLPRDQAGQQGGRVRLAWELGEVNLIVNGDFESGNVDGWTQDNSFGFGGMQIQDGTFDPLGPEGPEQPLSGSYCASLQQPYGFVNMPVTYVFLQQVSIPTNAALATLRWSDLINNYAGPDTFQDANPPHRFSVVIVSADGMSADFVFSTGPETPLFNSWTKRSVDVTRFQGQTVLVAFLIEIGLGDLNVSLDNVQLGVRLGGPVTNEVVFGTNILLTQDDSLGTTLNTHWDLADLAPDTTYFWRVLTHYGSSDNLGPVWQFRTSPLGPADHLDWSPISDPRPAGVAIPVVLTAKDVHDFTVTNFTGTVDLTAASLAAGSPHTLLTEQPYTALTTYDGATVGYSFTPSSDLLVHAVRSFSGKQISIWTDQGVLLTRQEVVPQPGSWVETPLAVPVTLLGGHTYRVGVYAPGLATQYTRFDAPAAFADGVIHQSYTTQGDGFPSNPHPAQWWYVDLAYSVPTARPLALSPVTSGDFANGAWSGSVSLSGSATNVQLRAQSAGGQLIGLGNLFDLVAANDADQDGMPDDWETQNGFDPNDPSDAVQDADGDGLINRDEYLAGTDPHQSASSLRVASISIVGNDVVLQFDSVNGKTYRIVRTDHLGQPLGTIVADDLPGTGAILEVTDTGALTVGSGFYRVEVLAGGP